MDKLDNVVVRTTALKIQTSGAWCTSYFLLTTNYNCYQRVLNICAFDISEQSSGKCYYDYKQTSNANYKHSKASAQSYHILSYSYISIFITYSYLFKCMYIHEHETYPLTKTIYIWNC